jgi:hypothetical protein
VALWLNHVAISAPRNGTTGHRISPTNTGTVGGTAVDAGTVVAGSTFTPTAGRFLICVSQAGVTSTTPSGWTLTQSAVNNTGQYLWSKTAAGSGDSDGVATTHNAANYLTLFHFFEFAANWTVLNSVANAAMTAAQTVANPNLTGLPGTAVVAMACRGQGVGSGNNTTHSATWSSATEQSDLWAAYATTDGYWLGIAYTEDHTGTSFQPSSTLTPTPLVTGEAMTWAVGPAPPVQYVDRALGGTTTTTSFSLTLPATQANDLIIVEYVHRATADATIGGTYSGPAFTEKHDQPFATSTFSGKTLWSIATGDHSGQTVTGSGLTNSCAAIATIYRPVGGTFPTDPLGDATIVGEQNASGDATNAQITTASAGAMVCLVVVNSPDLAISGQTCTSPGALTERAEVLSTGGTDASIAHASAAKATAGATGNFTWTQTAAANGSWAYAIKAPAAGTVVGDLSTSTADAVSEFDGTFVPPPIVGDLSTTTADALADFDGAFTPVPIVGDLSTSTADAAADFDGTLGVPGNIGDLSTTTDDSAADFDGTFVPPPIVGDLSTTTADAVADFDGQVTGTGIAYVSSSTTTYASRTNTTVTAPTGIQDGDLILLGILTGNNTEAVDPTPPAGFTLVASTDTSDTPGFNVEMRVYRKTAASESGNYTFTHATASSQGFALVYRGVDASSPLDVTATANNGGAAAGTTTTATGVTTVTANTRLVFIAQDWADTANNLTPPSGMTERFDVSPLIYAADALQASAGASGNKTMTNNTAAGSGSWSAVLVALRESGAGTRIGDLSTSTADAVADFDGSTAATGPVGDLSTTTADATATFVAQYVAGYTTIVEENALTGVATLDWWDDAGTGYDQGMLGFVSSSFTATTGSTVSFKIHAPSGGTLSIYRLGWYGGQHARLITTTAITSQTQPAPADQAGTNMRHCTGWTVNATWTIPEDAVGGLYLAVPRNGANASHIPFVVRNPVQEADADIIVKTSDTTWQAYNHFGTVASPTAGRSLYSGSTNDWTIATRAYAASYERPLVLGMAGDGRQSRIWNAEMDMLAWLERNGYKVSYVGCYYMESNPTVLDNRKAVVSSGHDEYYTQGMRDALEDARDGGTNLVFATANEVFWRGRWADSGRTFVCYKDTMEASQIDPVTWTGTWRDDRGVNIPEQTLTGLWFIANGIRNDSIAVPTSLNGRPFWRNTTIAGSGSTHTFSAGSAGFEWDYIRTSTSGRPTNILTLSSASITLTSAAASDRGDVYTNTGTYSHTIIIYKHSSGALVWNAGTNQWAWLLGDFHANDGRGSAIASTVARQAMVNLLADMDAQPASLQSGLTSATNQSSTYPWPESAIVGDLSTTTADAVANFDGLAVPPAIVGDLSTSTADAAADFDGSVANPVVGDLSTTTADAAADFDGTATPPGNIGDLSTSTADTTSTFAGTFTPAPIVGDLSTSTADVTVDFDGSVDNPGFSGELEATTADAVADFNGTRTIPPIVGDLSTATGDVTTSFVGAVVNPGFTGDLSTSTEDATADLAGTYTPPSAVGDLSTSTADATSQFVGAFVIQPVVGQLAATTAAAILHVAVEDTAGTVTVVALDDEWLVTADPDPYLVTAEAP